MISLLESLLTQLRPIVLPTDRLGHFERHVEIPAFNRQIESSRFILNEMQRNLLDIPSASTPPDTARGRTNLRETFLL